MTCDARKPTILPFAFAAMLCSFAPWAASQSETEPPPPEEAPADDPGTDVPAPPPTPEEEAEAEKADREDNLTYDPRGRRDPFRALTGATAGGDIPEEFLGTLRGLRWSEVKLTTIMKTPSGPIATFEGGVKKTGYFAREGSRFWNAIVHSIDYDSGTVVIREELDDPRLLKPYRDHPITLLPADQLPSVRNAAGRAALGGSAVVNRRRMPGGY